MQKGCSCCTPIKWCFVIDYIFSVYLHAHFVHYFVNLLWLQFIYICIRLLFFSAYGTMPFVSIEHRQISLTLMYALPLDASDVASDTTARPGAKGACSQRASLRQERAVLCFLRTAAACAQGLSRKISH